MRQTLVLCVLTCLVAASQSHAGSVVVPNANADVDANADTRLPLLVNGGMRYQQVYAASEFATFAPGGELLTGMSFRLDSRTGYTFGPLTIDRLIVVLSTTSAEPFLPSETFADNTGVDYVGVFIGSVTVGNTGLPGPGDTRAFDINIDFIVPFLYDPANGNLLVEIVNGDPSDNNIDLYFDADSISGAVGSVLGPEGFPATSGGPPSAVGLVTQFSSRPVPEPTTLALAALGLMGVACCRRR